MPIVTLKKDICCTRSTLFSLLTDFYQRLRWDCLARDMAFDGQVTRGKSGCLTGGRWWCLSKLKVEHLTLVAPASTVTLMTAGPWFIRRYNCYWRLEQLDSYVTRVNLRCSFESSMPFLRFFVNPLLAIMLTRDLNKELLCLQLAAEKGLYSSKPRMPDIVSVPLVTK